MVRAALASLCLATLAGCAAPRSIDWQLFDAGWSAAGRAETAADGQAVAAAGAKMMAALAALRDALEQNSMSGNKKELAMLLGSNPNAYPASFASPDRLEMDIARLLDEADAAETGKLIDFRRSIGNRAHPDGMDPVRRAILDHEMRRRQSPPPSPPPSSSSK